MDRVLIECTRAGGWSAKEVEQGILETAGEWVEESGVDREWEGEEDKIGGEAEGHIVVEGGGNNEGGSTIGGGTLGDSEIGETLEKGNRSSWNMTSLEMYIRSDSRWRHL
jgi:hypothetical protein